jgi:hypothetical protein
MADEFLNFQQHATDQTFSDPHTEWQHTTVLGKLTLLLHRLGDNPFTHAIIAAFKQGDESGFSRSLKIGSNISAIIGAVAVAYAIGRILQIFLGKEIVIHQEIVVEEEVKLSDLLNKSQSDKNSIEGESSKSKNKSRRGKTQSTVKQD